MSTKMTTGNQQNLLTMKTNLKQSYEKKMSLFKEKVQQKIQETLSNSKTTHATTMNAMTEKVQQQSQELKELKMELHLASELETELSAQVSFGKFVILLTKDSSCFFCFFFPPRK
jgi:DNA-binding transcriptional regulator GbsR (MarR family)